MTLLIVCCSDHKRHDNFIDIGICPKTGVRPRKLELADMDVNDEGAIVSSIVSSKLLVFLLLSVVCRANGMVMF